jgi:DNA-binding transcriptional MerR regulator
MTTQIVKPFWSITELAQELNVSLRVIRYWENKFPQFQPLLRAGGRRYYRQQDVETARQIHQLIYNRGYNIKAALAHLQNPKDEAATPARPSKSTSEFEIYARIAKIRANLKNHMEEESARLQH